MTKNKGGRPTKMTPEVIRKLEEAFTKGCTDTEACCYADIGMSTLYDYCVKYEEFSDRKEILKDQPTMKAKFIIGDSLEEKSLSTAHKVIDRKEGKKLQLSSDPENPLTILISEISGNTLEPSSD